MPVGKLDRRQLPPASHGGTLRADPAGRDNTQLTIVVETNRPYLIQASSDLASWQTLATVISATVTTATFTDPNTGATRIRFYRAVAQ